MKRNAQSLYLELTEKASQEELGCRQFPEAYFMSTDRPEDLQLNKLAISICNKCPIKNLCLTYAIEANEPFGIWGGKTTSQRKRLKATLKASKKFLK